MADATYEVQANDAASEASVARVDMKFEIVVIPVSNVDRAKEFYGRLGWRLDADYDNGNDFRVIQFTPPGSGCSVIFGKNVTAAAPGSAQGLYLIVSDIEAPRKNCSVTAWRSARCSTTPAVCTQARTSPTFSVGNASAVAIPSIAATVRSPRSVIRTGTAGCSRRSRRDCPGVSTPRRRASHRRTTWPAPFGVRRPPMASTRNEPGSTTQTGPTGTPHTWWRSRRAKSCPNKRLRRDRYRSRRDVEALDHEFLEES